MEKKIRMRFLYGIAIVWIVVLIQFIWKEHTAREVSGLNQVCVTMDQLLKEQKATDISYIVTLVASSSPRTEEEQYVLLRDVANLVKKESLEEEVNFLEQNSANGANFSIKEETRRNGTSLSWEVRESDWYVSAQYLDMAEDYVVLSVECRGTDACVQASCYMTYFQEFVKKYDLTGIPCGKLIAYLPKEFTFTERNILSENLLYLFQAKEVDGIRGADLYTIYGYSNLIPFYIIVAEQPMNVNLSFSLIEDTQQTKLQIGIPIL